MNIQAMMKQAQKIQKDMLTAKDEIEKTVFIGKSSFVTAEVMGNKKVSKIKINAENLELDDIEILEDMIKIACNNAFNDVDKAMEDAMGAYGGALNGLI